MADNTLKQTDQYIDKKREEVVETVAQTKQAAEESSTETVTNLLGKAKGFLKCN